MIQIHILAFLAFSILFLATCRRYIYEIRNISLWSPFSPHKPQLLVLHVPVRI
ncbi:hypothetical protein M378DRAFT_168502 [Amanita muscaria Koide BX008]|uniref:Uncharacterized protein n=1 Tax=Amanita muscaria (strain Koide BX008) TaxID=946122 RepID=A0A0C2WUS6_AMAMK|nr:hypothetical protein M378DRAFT_168502 [Amanita muscaria Koide BX008]